MMDNATIRNVDITDLVYAEHDIVSVAGGSRSDNFLDGGFYPDDVLYIEYIVAAQDELANEVRLILEEPSTGEEILRTSSGDGSNPDELKTRVQGSIYATGDMLLGGTDDPPASIEYQIRNDGGSSVDFAVTLHIWKIHEDFATGIGGSATRYAGQGVTPESFDA